MKRVKFWSQIICIWLAISLVIACMMTYVQGGFKCNNADSLTVLSAEAARLHQTIVGLTAQRTRQDSIIDELASPARGFRRLKPGYAIYLKADSSAYMFRDQDCGLIVVWLKDALPVSEPIPKEWFTDDKTRPRY